MYLLETSMLRIREIMSRDVTTFARDTAIRAALEKLSSSRMSGAPVIDNGKVCGIISVADIVGVIATASDPSAAGMKSVGEVMTGHVHSLPSDAPVRNAASMMRENRIHRVLVIDDGELVGVVSALDVARAVSDVGTGSIHVIKPGEGDPSPWVTG
jgi:CBS domain-containing protein